jgi:hypothetical protein
MLGPIDNQTSWHKLLYIVCIRKTLPVYYGLTVIVRRYEYLNHDVKKAITVCHHAG